MTPATVHQLYREVARLLTEAGVENARREAAWLTASFLDCGQERLLLPEPLTRDPAPLFALTARRAAGEPLQYLLGTQSFMGMELRVGPGVLIPRPETELLCRVGAEALTGLSEPTVLDLCAGSGCVSLGICSLCPQARVYAVEKYEDAFAWLERNLRDFPRYRVTAVRADVLTDDLPELPQADLLAANPPYIAESERPALQRELDYEPRQALFAEDGGLRFYGALAALGAKKLKPGGIVALEIGAGQSVAVEKILEKNGFVSVKTLRDPAGLDRVVRAKKP